MTNNSKINSMQFADNEISRKTKEMDNSSFCLVSYFYQQHFWCCVSADAHACQLSLCSSVGTHLYPHFPPSYPSAHLAPPTQTHIWLTHTSESHRQPPCLRLCTESAVPPL
jgi:hypothetical protein